MSSGDIVAAAAFFAPNGRMLTADRTEVSGRDAITDLPAQIVESQIHLEIGVGRTLNTGTIALSTQYWRRWSRDARDRDFDHSTVASLVLAVGDEKWGIVIVSPWG